MTTSTCAVPDCLFGGIDGHVCRPHMTAYQDKLRLVADDTVDELLVTITRQDRLARPAGGGSTEEPLLFRVDASDAARDLHATLVHAAAQVAELLDWTTDQLRDLIGRDPDGILTGARTWAPADGDVQPDYRWPATRPSGPLPGPRTVEIALWLARHPETVRHDPGGGEIVSAVVDAVTRARWAIDRPTDRAFLGLCRCELFSDEERAAFGTRARELWASRDAEVVSCRACDARYDVHERRTELLAMSEKLLVTAELASRALPGLLDGAAELTPDKIAGWVRFHGLRRYKPEAHDPHRRHRFLVGDLIDQLNAERERTLARVRPPTARLHGDVASLFDQIRAGLSRGPRSAEHDDASCEG